MAAPTPSAILATLEHTTGTVPGFSVQSPLAAQFDSSTGSTGWTHQEGQIPPALPSDLQYNFDDSSLAHFLNDIMLPTPPIPDAFERGMDHTYPLHTPRDLMDFGNFSLDPELEVLFDNSDHDLLIPLSSSKALYPPQGSGSQTPALGREMAAGTAAFLRSMWVFTPTNENHSAEDRLNLSLPYSDVSSPETRAVYNNAILHHHIDNSLRDKILAAVLSTCDESLYPAVCSCFPSADILNKLMHIYMNINSAQVTSWLHLPTMRIGDESLELLIMIISAGAVVCSEPSIRRLGLALQEAARMAIAKKVRTIHPICNLLISASSKRIIDIRET